MGFDITKNCFVGHYHSQYNSDTGKQVFRVIGYFIGSDLHILRNKNIFIGYDDDCIQIHLEIGYCYKFFQDSKRKICISNGINYDISGEKVHIEKLPLIFDISKTTNILLENKKINELSSSYQECYLWNKKDSILYDYVRIVQGIIVPRDKPINGFRCEGLDFLSGFDNPQEKGVRSLKTSNCFYCSMRESLTSILNQEPIKENDLSFTNINSKTVSLDIPDSNVQSGSYEGEFLSENDQSKSIQKQTTVFKKTKNNKIVLQPKLLYKDHEATLSPEFISYVLTIQQHFLSYLNSEGSLTWEKALKSCKSLSLQLQPSDLTFSCNVYYRILFPLIRLGLVEWGIQGGRIFLFPVQIKPIQSSSEGYIARNSGFIRPLFSYIECGETQFQEVDLSLVFNSIPSMQAIINSLINDGIDWSRFKYISYDCGYKFHQISEINYKICVQDGAIYKVNDKVFDRQYLCAKSKHYIIPLYSEDLDKHYYVKLYSRLKMNYKIMDYHLQSKKLECQCVSDYPIFLFRALILSNPKILLNDEKIRCKASSLAIEDFRQDLVEILKEKFGNDIVEEHDD
jgi:hypothetical protein